MDKNFILSLLLVFIYHYGVHNGIEKTFVQTFLDSDNRRPCNTCKKRTVDELPIKCMGMPSGHAESGTIIFLLLLFKGYLSNEQALLLVFLLGFQRVIANRHTVPQVVAGTILGCIYAFIYKQFSHKGFLIIFLIGVALAHAIITKVDKYVYDTPYPEWIDKSMYSAMDKKKSSPYYIKYMTVMLTSSYIQEELYLKWNRVEYSLDKLIDIVKKSGIKYDAVVGIKTGGAVISDYVSNKLGIKNYKIKISKAEFGCDKKPIDAVQDSLGKAFRFDSTRHMICEPINDNIEGKNILLIDEVVSSGSTMKGAYEYLMQEKKVNKVFPTTIFLKKDYYKAKLDIEHIYEGLIFVWPWGWDN